MFAFKPHDPYTLSFSFTDQELDSILNMMVASMTSAAAQIDQIDSIIEQLVVR